MAEAVRLGDPPSKVAQVLAANRPGVAGVVFFVVAAAAPLTTAAGGAVAGFAVTDTAGMPVAYAVLAAIFAVFAVGYVAMSRHLVNAGAFHAYVTQGLGRVPGVGAGFVAVLAYNAMQIGLYGIFGVALSDLLLELSGMVVPWWVGALAGWAVVGLVGVLRVAASGRVLAGLLIAECLVIVGYDLVFVANPAGGEGSLDTVDPGTALGVGWGASLAVAMVGFAGFAGGAVFAGETRDARRTVARATFLAIGLMGLLYTVSSWALSGKTGPDRIGAAAREQGPMLPFNLGAPHLGPTLTHLAQILFVTSLLAALLGFHNMVARYLFSLGREEVLPRGLGATHYRTGSPYVGSLTQSALALAVLILAASGDADPVAALFVAGAGLGAVGVLLLMITTSAAVIGYFRTRPGVESPWRRVGAPALGGGLLAVLLVLVLIDFHTLIGVSPGDPRAWALPAVYAVAAAAGVSWGLVLRARWPRIYRTIGLGANRVTGRAISELDGVEPIGAGSPPASSPAETGTVVAGVRTDLTVHRLHLVSDVDFVAGVLAEAYQHGQPGEWLIPDPAERARVYPGLFRILAAHALRGDGEVYTTSDRNAVAIWYPAPYGVPVPSPSDYDAQLAAIAGPYQARFLALEAALQAAHPIEAAHHYLHFIGVRPDRQGRGIGSALLAHRLTDLHRRGIPAYLEATNGRNLTLFRRHGCTVLGTVTAPDHGPTLHRLWRDAR